MKRRYYSLYQNEDSNSADIYIYGDITSWPWYEEETSSYTLSKELEEMGDVDEINIYINSYGGEVAEGLAIYNALKRHKAKITTYVDGFACSIASVIFAAGDERIVTNTSLIMIHNAWTYVQGNAEELKKQAEDLEIITQASINAYLNIVNIEEDELRDLMDKETWLSSDMAIEKGFATKLIDVQSKEVANQSIKQSVAERIVHNPKPDKPINLDEEKIGAIVKNEIKSLEEKILKSKPKTKEDIENKPLNMMKAFFNVENKEDK